MSHHRQVRAQAAGTTAPHKAGNAAQLPLLVALKHTGAALPPYPTSHVTPPLGAQAVYVSAGALGRQALQGGVQLPSWVIALGVLATGAAIVLIGHVAQQTLQGMDLDPASSKKGGKKGGKKGSA